MSFAKVVYHGFTAISLGKIACAIRSQKLLDEAHRHGTMMKENMEIFYKKHPEFRK